MTIHTFYFQKSYISYHTINPSPSKSALLEKIPKMHKSIGKMRVTCILLSFRGLFKSFIITNPVHIFMMLYPFIQKLVGVRAEVFS